MKIKKNIHLLQDMGAKLENFRTRLGFALGCKKINQDMFGEMFGGYSLRSISSYESGDSEMPGPLLYAIWQAGGSVDGIFGYLEIDEQAGIKLADRHRFTIARKNKIEDFAETELERALEGVQHSDGKKAKKTKIVAGANASRRKKGDPAARAISRRKRNV
jgi:hypothetical protein